MILTAEQERAIGRVHDWYGSGMNLPPFTLFGAAGTGKSTLAQYFAEDKSNVLFACYTGKAASVLRRKGCRDARTIHSLIYKPAPKSTKHIIELEEELKCLQQSRYTDPLEIYKCTKDIAEAKEDLKDLRFTLNEESVLSQCSLLILDECSMIPESMGRDLLSFGCPILVLGDPYQLPPVKGAAFFSNRNPDFMLEEIHRQAKDSGIIRFATDIRNGTTKGDMEYGDEVDICSTDEFVKGCRPYIRPPEQVLVGLNKTRRNANVLLRQQRGLTSEHPETTDRVICLRNNQDRGLLNGAQFDVLSCTPKKNGTLSLHLVDEDGQEIYVAAHKEPFEGKEVHWQHVSEAESFDFADAITVHKSQGSQYDDVVVIDESREFRQDRRKHAYTAATRAAKSLVWVR